MPIWAQVTSMAAAVCWFACLEKRVDEWSMYVARDNRARSCESGRAHYTKSSIHLRWGEIVFMHVTERGVSKTLETDLPDFTVRVLLLFHVTQLSAAIRRARPRRSFRTVLRQAGRPVGRSRCCYCFFYYWLRAHSCDPGAAFTTYAGSVGTHAAIGCYLFSRSGRTKVCDSNAMLTAATGLIVAGGSCRCFHSRRSIDGRHWSS